ncbi:Protein of unknown function DUF597 protein, partial [Actinidia chinensis var. chinensis]
LDCSNLPRWLGALMREKFFNACIIHEEAKKNEKNIFCLDCCESICPHCLSPHRNHRLLQIRRYVYHDVIRLGDAEKLMDCAFVQSYTTNSAKVVFLNQRPQARPCRGSGNICISCYRGLQDPYLFCSLSCKLQHILGTDGKMLSKYIFECKYMTLPEPGLDDGQMTPDSVLEPAGSLRTTSGSSESDEPSEVVRKRRSNLSALRQPCTAACLPASLMSRRKGTPHRAPLY